MEKQPGMYLHLSLVDGLYQNIDHALMLAYTGISGL